MISKAFSGRNYYGLLFVASLVYALLTFFGPKGPNKYDLSDLEFGLIRMTIVIPVILIWIAAFYGAVRFKAYAERIKKSPDGKALVEISNGLIILAIALVVLSIVGTLRQVAINNGYEEIFFVLRGYLEIGFSLAAFSKIFSGSKKLVKIVDKSENPRQRQLPLIVFTAGASILYAFMVLNGQYRNSTPDPAAHSSYYLPDPLIVLTIIFPYVVIWFYGALAASNIWAYKEKTKGVIYKTALSKLVIGILAVTLFSIAIHMLTAAATSLSSLSLGAILLLIYVILIFYAVGYLYIAVGSKQLERIEKVK